MASGFDHSPGACHDVPLNSLYVIVMALTAGLIGIGKVSRVWDQSPMRFILSFKLAVSRMTAYTVKLMKGLLAVGFVIMAAFAAIIFSP
jgi:hypothetical protein